MNKNILVLNTEKDIMKKIYRPLIKGTNWALAGLLGLLGFTACENGLGGDDEEPLMYGVPWASHAIKGAVVDKATGKPIEGIEVKLAIPDSLLRNANISYPNTWKATTDSKGEYKLSDTWPNISEKGLPIALNDIDGEKNGSYKSDTIYVDTTKGKHVPADPNKQWFNGEFVTTADFTMEEDKADE